MPGRFIGFSSSVPHAVIPGYLGREPVEGIR